MLSDSILIAKNVQLTFKLTAKEVYVSCNGDITLIVKQLGPCAPCPDLTVEYLESLCRDFYYGGKPHRHAIADILLLNGLLSSFCYGDFYDSLRDNLENNSITVISSEIFQ